MARSKSKDDDLIPQAQASRSIETGPPAAEENCPPLAKDASQKLLSLIRKPAEAKPTAETVGQLPAESSSSLDAAAEAIIEAADESVAESSPAPILNEKQEQLVAQVAKDLSEDFDASVFAPPAMPPPPTVAPSKKLDPDLHLTLMDIPRFTGIDSSVEGPVSKEIHKSPPSPAVTDFKCATACSSFWSKMTGTQQFRICNACKLTVYDFTAMNRNQAQAMVFRREGKQNPIFWKRVDGRFMTSDCPVGVRKRQLKTIVLVSGILIVAGVIAITILLPPPAPPPPPAATKPAEAVNSSPMQPAYLGKPGGNELNPQSTFTPWHSGDLFSNQAPTGATAANQFVSVPKEVLDKYLELKRVNSASSSTPLPDASASPSGHYVDVPRVVLEEYQRMRQNQAPAASFPTQQPTPAAGPAQSSWSSDSAAPPSSAVPAQPDNAPNSANPYIKNY